jgi:hypothetical protein
MRAIKWYLYGELDRFHFTEEYEWATTQEEALASFMRRHPTATSVVCRKSINQSKED